MSESTFNSYCYITNTFTLAEEQHTGVYSGVGPGQQDSKPIYHSYYQWVPFLLLIQAASFYLPFILYKFAHDNRITQLIQDLQNCKPFNEIRDDKIGDIHIYLQVNKTQQAERLRSHRSERSELIDQRYERSRDRLNT